MQIKTIKAYTSILFILSCFCIFFLLGYNILQELSTHDDFIIIQQSNLQITREEYLVKEVLILQNKPESQASAINALQTNLPVFERIQSGLLNGDAVDGIPNNPPESVKQSLQEVQNDYLAITTAMQKLLANPDKHPDPIQVAIILQHDQNYALSMYQVAVLYQQDAETRKLQFFIIQMTTIVILLVAVLVKYLLFTRTLLEKTSKA